MKRSHTVLYVLALVGFLIYKLSQNPIHNYAHVDTVGNELRERNNLIHNDKQSTDHLAQIEDPHKGETKSSSKEGKKNKEKNKEKKREKEEAERPPVKNQPDLGLYEEEDEELSRFTPWFVRKVPFEAKKRGRGILERLYLFTVVATFESPVLIGHLLDYYLGIGVLSRNIHIELHVGNGTGKYHEALLQVLEERKIGHLSIWEGMWSDPEKLARGDRAQVKMGLKEGDWILHIDSDEFQEYPLPLGEFLNECEQLNITITKGIFFDRIAEDGSFPKVTPEINLKEDFPWCCQVTKHVMKANYNKLGPFKFGVTANSGGYHNFNVLLKRNAGRWCFRALRVHHFKWVDGVIKEMDTRVNGVLIESKRLNDHVEAHGGKICHDCSELRCERVNRLPKLITPMEAYDQKDHDVLFTTQLYIPKKGDLKT